MPVAGRQTLLLIPGLLCDSTVWRAQRADLVDLADCVVADHGDADSLEDMARRALALVPGEASFALAGHSMGGRVALEILRLAPARVTRIALMDTGYQARPPGHAGEAEQTGRKALLDQARAQGMRAMGEAWSRGMLHPDRLGGPVQDEVLRMIERSTPARFEAQIQALLRRPDATPQLVALAVPTLLLCGRDDTWSPVSRHIEMQRLVPEAELVIIENSGHMVTMERPVEVGQAMRKWLVAREANPGKPC
ncbi:MAG: alpha/beta hydrolase [Burkholderiaceae bacterium]